MWAGRRSAPGRDSVVDFRAEVFEFAHDCREVGVDVRTLNRSGTGSGSVNLVAEVGIVYAAFILID